MIVQDVKMLEYDQHVLDDELFNEYSLKRIFRNIIFVTIRGISTQKGIEKMDRLLEKNPL